MQMAEDKRRMSSSISYNRSGKMSGRSSRYSRRLRDDSDGESDEDRPKSGKSARQRRASRRASEIRSREKVLDSEYYGYHSSFHSILSKSNVTLRLNQSITITLSDWRKGSTLWKVL